MKKQFKHCTVCVLITALFLCFTACKERNITLPLPNLSGIPGANSSSTNEGHLPGVYGSESGTGSTLGNKKSSAEAALDELRTEMRMNGYSLAVGYLGHYRSGYKDLESYLFSSGILDEFPFLENFPQSRFVDCAGDELYLIVPLEEDANLFVNNWYIDESNDYLGGTNPYEEAIYSNDGDGEPLLLSCNVSETMPNAVVCVIQHMNCIEYTPMLSLMDGSLCLDDDDIMDVSFNRDDTDKWEDGPVDVTGWHSLSEDKVCGHWEGYVMPDDGRSSCAVHFTLFSDGTAYYQCVMFENGELSDKYFIYEGEWERQEFNQSDRPASAYTFHLTLNQGDSNAGDYAVLTEIHTTQFITADNYAGLSMQIVAGDSLYPSEWEYEVLLYSAEG